MRRQAIMAPWWGSCPKTASWPSPWPVSSSLSFRTARASIFESRFRHPCDWVMYDENSWFHSIQPGCFAAIFNVEKVLIVCATRMSRMSRQKAWGTQFLPRQFLQDGFRLFAFASWPSTWRPVAEIFLSSATCNFLVAFRTHGLCFLR